MVNINENYISIIIPAYNEEKRIIHTIMKVKDYCEKNFNKYEIIIVDDGSTDNTKEALFHIFKDDNTIKFITYEKNRGKGYAVKKGAFISEGNFTLITDADLSTPIEEVEKLFMYINKGYDIVIGSRALKDSEILIKQPWWRRFMGRVFNKLVRIIINLDYLDTQCGFKLFKGGIAKSLFNKAKINRFAFDVEVLYLAKRNDYSVIEVPVRWLNSPYSKVKPIKDSLECFKDLIKIKLFNKYNS